MDPGRRRNALLLDGRNDEADATLGLLHDALVDGLKAGGWAVDDWRIRDEKMAWCSGCFGCWVKTPGECVYKDASHEGDERASRADLLVILTPVTFGGYSAEAKKALDHTIGIHLPYLKKIGADSHHPPRYDRRHDLLAVGTVPAGEGGGVEAQTFQRLAARNILNLYPGRQVNAVVESGTGEADIRCRVTELLSACGIRAGSPEEVRA
jgi:multimeric flavodoxin WrbA